MGGGSDTSQEQTSKVTTNTTTNIRDVGFTGAAGVDLVDILQRGAIDSEAIRATSLQTIAQQNGKNFNQLVGGAGVLFKELIDSSDKSTANVVNSAKNVSQEGLNTVRYLADSATGNKSESEIDSQTTLYIALALAAGYGLVKTIGSK